MISIRRGTTKATRIYIWPSNETISENLINRRSRPHEEWRMTIIPELIKRGFIDKDTKMTWDRFAGCTMCPCSPGFKTNVKLGYDIHVGIL